VRPYCRTNSTFQTKAAKCDQDRVKKLGDHIVAPIRLLKQISTVQSYYRTNSMFEYENSKKARFEIGATILSHQFHVSNKNSKVRPRSRPKTMRPYFCTNSSSETKTVLCHHIVAPIPHLELKQQKSEIRNWCDYMVVPIPHF
jgi:hypothetical protein